MATHRRRKSKDGQIRHQFIVRIKGQRPISKTFDRKAEGRAWAAGMETKCRHGEIDPKPESHEYTLHMVIEEYRRDVLAKNVKLAGFRGAQHQRWDRTLGGVSMNRVTPALISKARREIERAHNLGPATSNKHLSALSALFEYAKSELFWTQVNPCSQVIRRKEPPGRIRYLSDSERARLLQACRDSPSPILYDVVVIALWTGARKNEVLSARRSQVDLTPGWERIILAETKNEDPHCLYLFGEALGIVKRIVAVPRIHTDFLFPNKAGNGPATIKKAWYPALAAAKIQNFHFHDLRHTTATMLAKVGCSLAVIGKVLGHRSIESTRRYAHITDDLAAGAVRDLDRVLGSR